MTRPMAPDTNGIAGHSARKHLIQEDAERVLTNCNPMGKRQAQIDSHAPPTRRTEKHLKRDECSCSQQPAHVGAAEQAEKGCTIRSGDQPGQKPSSHRD